MNKSVTCSTDDSSLVLSLDMKFVNVTMVQCWPESDAIQLTACTGSVSHPSR